MLINEGGINWAWFTNLEVHEDGVVIISRYRVHKYDMEWTQAEKDAIRHPHYYHETIVKEDDKRTALEYFVPEKGWMKIKNPMHIFKYPEIRI
jgi:hypothetical protein